MDNIILDEFFCQKKNENEMELRTDAATAALFAHEIGLQKAPRMVTQSALIRLTVDLLFLAEKAGIEPLQILSLAHTFFTREKKTIIYPERSE